jgi:hypothetical protein
MRNAAISTKVSSGKSVRIASTMRTASVPSARISRLAPSLAG